MDTFAKMQNRTAAHRADDAVRTGLVKSDTPMRALEPSISSRVRRITSALRGAGRRVRSSIQP